MAFVRLLRARGVRCALYVALLALASITHWLTALSVTDVELTQDGHARAVTFPFSAPTTSEEPLAFRATLHAGPLARRTLVVLPDDHFESLSLNGQPVPLTGVAPAQLDDYQHGFTLALGSRLVRGDNPVVATVLNHGGPGGLDLYANPLDLPNLLGVVAPGLGALLALLAELLLALGCKAPTVGVAVVAVVERLAYLSVTPFDLREHDVRGHVEYIEYLLAHRALPSPGAGYSFYHPALYYTLAALQWAGLSALGFSRGHVLVSLQAQSVAYDLGFSVLGIATGRLWLDRAPDGAFGRGLLGRRWVHGLLAALVLLWPASVVHSVRIGNDDLAYLFFGGGLYLASRWWLLGRDRDLVWAAVVAALGVVTKTNDALVFGVLLLCFVARLALVERERRVGAYVRRGLAPVVLLALALAGALGTAVRDKLAGSRPNLLIANAELNSTALIVGNHAKSYLWFDPWVFVTKPFSSAWDDAMGRQWFWNYLLKTGLFGEFAYPHPALGALAKVASALCLAMLVALVAGLALRRRAAWLDELPLELTVVLSVVSLALLRMSIPRSCSGDFRYVLPVVVPCAYAYVKLVTLCRERGWGRLAAGGALVAWAFVGVSTAFFLVIAAVRG